MSPMFGATSQKEYTEMSSDNLTMGRPGTQFSGDRVSLSWPKNRDGSPGHREVKEVPPGARSGRIKRMIVDGSIVETDLPTTDETPTVQSNRQLFPGGSREAVRRMREPAGPVIRQVFAPVGEVVGIVAPTSVLEDDADRRPAPPEQFEEQEPVVPELTFEERVTEMSDKYQLSTLQRKARETGLTADNVDWKDKQALASAILTRELAAEEPIDGQTDDESEPARG